MGNLQSSSSSNNTDIKYDVFISFRGDDTRRGFTSHLHEGLRGKYIETFVDYRIERGDDIDAALLRAIKESKISVVIFSKDYASSKWCLNELVEIMKHVNENNQIVIPVFYDVDPSDVSEQTGSFQNSFDQHVKDLPEDQVQTWREALTKACGKAGWPSSVESTDAELVSKVVNDVLKRLMSQYISPGFGGIIGLERINRILKLLRLDDRTNVLIIGILGMGGVGKSTLADAIFNNNSNHFEGVCFIQNVRERLQNTGGLAVLQKDILSKVLNDKNLELDSPTISPQIKERLNRIRVFIVLDDVDDFLQIEPLFNGVDGLGKGSRILITTRNRHVLLNCCVNIDNIYEVEGFKHHEALKLFCSYAFKDSHPTEDFKELSEKFVDYAKGNPLALKVLGSSLYVKKKQVWESAIKTLQTNLDDRISNVLKVSFDGLNDREKKIFLDIACLLKGEEEEYVAKILDDCDDSLSVLIDKSLITISSWDDSIQMHDLLQEMGRKIVHNESPDEVGKRSRLWRQEDVLDTLKRDDGTKAVQGIVLDMFEIEDMCLSHQAFKEMHNLRLLKFHDSTCLIEDHYVYYIGPLPPYHSKLHFGEGLTDLSRELRSLIWLGYPLPALPSNFDPNKLVELDLRCSNVVERLWDDAMNAPNLKQLFLGNCTRLTKIPDLSESPLIETIDISYCSSLLDFPPLARHVNKLFDLFMKGCKSLRSFPSNVHFESLESLHLCGNKNITKFPEISGKIAFLDLSGTAIDEVPPSIQRLTDLWELDLSHCTSLQHIPDSIWKLKSLRHLILKNCSRLESIPEILDTVEFLPSIQRLTDLWELNLSHCTSLQHIPNSIWKLKSLRRLNLQNCSRLESIPEILDKVEFLEKLKLSGTAIKKLPKNLGDLKSLELLSVDETAISQLPSSMKHLKNLKKLSCRNCNLKEIQEDICHLTSLSHLDLSFNHFEHLPKGMKQLCALEDLNLNNCKMLQSLTELPSSLQHLSASDCEQLRSIPDASIFGEILRKKKPTFKFTNCLKLEAAVGNMLAQLRKYHNVESYGYSFCYSGSEVPGWFVHTTEGSSITFGAPKCQEFFGGHLLGFAICAVIVFEKSCDGADSEDSEEEDFGDPLEVIYHFTTRNKMTSGRIAFARKYRILINSDHVALKFLSYPYEFTNCSFRFFLSELSPNCRVKYCGACPIYANQNIGETSGRRSRTTNDHQEEEVEPHSRRLNLGRSLSL